jgi:hypothetical protein
VRTMARQIERLYRDAAGHRKALDAHSFQQRSEGNRNRVAESGGIGGAK